MKKFLNKIFNRNNLGVILLVAAFLVCLIVMQTGLFRAFIHDKEGDFLPPSVDQIGTFCTVESETVPSFSLALSPTRSKQVGRVPKRRCVKILKTAVIDQVSWVQIEYAGVTGWLTEDKLSFLSSKDLTMQTGSQIFVNIKGREQANAYASPQWDPDPVAEEIPYGEEFTLLDVENGWGKVKYQDRECWINLYYASGYVTDTWTVKALDDETKAIFLKKENSDASKTLKKIPDGTDLLMKEFKNGWGKVSYKNQTGWVKLVNLIPKESKRK